MPDVDFTKEQLQEKDKMKALGNFAKKYYLQVPDDLKGVCDEFKSQYEAIIKQYNEDECDISDVLRAVKAYLAQVPDPCCQFPGNMVSYGIVYARDPAPHAARFVYSSEQSGLQESYASSIPDDDAKGCKLPRVKDAT